VIVYASMLVLIWVTKMIIQAFRIVDLTWFLYFRIVLNYDA
jgi:ABC-type phosphate transport system ATPase subunit